MDSVEYKLLVMHCNADLQHKISKQRFESRVYLTALSLLGTNVDATKFNEFMTSLHGDANRIIATILGDDNPPNQENNNSDGYMSEDDKVKYLEALSKDGQPAKSLAEIVERMKELRSPQ